MNQLAEIGWLCRNVERFVAKCQVEAKTGPAGPGSSSGGRVEQVRLSFLRPLGRLSHASCPLFRVSVTFSRRSSPATIISFRFSRIRCCRRQKVPAFKTLL